MFSNILPIFYPLIPFINPRLLYYPSPTNFILPPHQPTPTYPLSFTKPPLAVGIARRSDLRRGILQPRLFLLLDFRPRIYSRIMPLKIKHISTYFALSPASLHYMIFPQPYHKAKQLLLHIPPYHQG